MIDASELLTNLVAKLRASPDLVTEMGGDPARIYATDHRVFRLIVKGVPTTDGIPLLNATVHDAC